MSRLFGKYTAEEVLKGILFENPKLMLKINVLSIEAAKNSPLYGVTGFNRQTMALDCEVNADMANGHDIEPLLAEINQQNMEGVP